MKIINELYSQTFLRYLPKEILSLMLPYPPSTVPIKQFSFTLVHRLLHNLGLSGNILD